MKRRNGFLSRFVFSVLRDIPETRDDWMLLIKLVHDTEMSVKKIKREDYYDHFFNNEFSNVDSIKRVWALIQERNPKLRGLKWRERQKMSRQISDTINNQLNLF
jgi:hypothetical protein